VLEGEAEQVTNDAELTPVGEAFAAKYATDTWDFVVLHGAFIHRCCGAGPLCAA